MVEELVAWLGGYRFLVLPLTTTGFHKLAWIVAEFLLVSAIII